MCAADVRSRVSFSVTKIRRPLPRAGLVGRPALERRLAEALGHGGVVLLSAAGGWGKSVALVRALGGGWSSDDIAPAHLAEEAKARGIK